MVKNPLRLAARRGFDGVGEQEKRYTRNNLKGTLLREWDLLQGTPGMPGTTGYADLPIEMVGHISGSLDAGIGVGVGIYDIFSRAYVCLNPSLPPFVVRPYLYVNTAYHVNLKCQDEVCF